MIESSLLEDDRKGAVLSDDRRYRYRLWRGWDVDEPVVAFVMLNPSTADATADDPTIRRLVGYATEWGYGGLLVGNLFAFRTPEPERLREVRDPVGPDNDAHLRSIVDDAETVVAAWGTHGALDGRAREAVEQLDVEWQALGTTQDGHPVHPLFQPADAELEAFGYGGEVGR